MLLTGNDHHSHDHSENGYHSDRPHDSYLPPHESSHHDGGGNGYPGHSSHSGGDGGGSSGSGSSEGEPAKYEFTYDVKDESAELEFGHSESRDGDYTTGQYYVLLPDGRKQIVEYEADQDGYRPKIRYEGGSEDHEGQHGGGGHNGYPKGGPDNHSHNNDHSHNDHSHNNDHHSSGGYPRGGPDNSHGHGSHHNGNHHNNNHDLSTLYSAPSQHGNGYH